MRWSSRIITACFVVALLFSSAWCEDYSQSTYYTIDVGNGDVVFIIGTENAVYVPAPQNTHCEPVRATMLGDGSTVVVMPNTELAVMGTRVKWQRVVLLIDSTGQCRVLEALQ